MSIGGLGNSGAASLVVPVDFPDQSIAQWEALGQTADAVLQRGDIVGDLHHIVEGHTGGFLEESLAFIVHLDRRLRR